MEVLNNDLDILYVRMGEEAIHIRKLGYILDSFDENLRTKLVPGDF